MAEELRSTETRRAGGPVAARPEARRLPLVPKEHGASFMSVHALLLGAVAGFVAGGRSASGLVVAVAVVATFLPLSAAVSVLTHRALAERARRRAAGLGLVLLVLGLLALGHGPARQLFGLAMVAAVLGGVYALCRIRSGPRSVATELAAIAGISLIAPLTYLLISGPQPGWPLSAAAAFLAFGGTVPYVRERVHRRRARDADLGRRLRGGGPAVAWQAVALLAAAVAWLTGLVDVLVPLAFVPGAVKTMVGIARPESAPPIRRLGYLETALSTTFAVLAGVGLALGV